MIFFQLFYTFLLIGAFTFGGGYSMIALIQNEVVVRHGWITSQEFTDLLAVSQMTPGPVGINTATYCGYTAVINQGYPVWAAVGGSLIASLSVIVIPIALVMIVGGWLMRHRDHPRVAMVMRFLRLTVIGLIAVAAIQLFVDTFEVDTLTGFRGNPLPSVFNWVVFLAVFLLSLRRRVSPIVLILLSGLAGLVVYSL